jgi:hypothetical protein
MSRSRSSGTSAGGDDVREALRHCILPATSRYVGGVTCADNGRVY